MSAEASLKVKCKKYAKHCNTNFSYERTLAATGIVSPYERPLLHYACRFDTDLR